MAFRGRGRGRGGGRGFGSSFDIRIGKHVPYEDFPENVTLPSLPTIDPLPDEVKALIASKLRLEHFWKTSCYNLQAVASKSKNQDADIQRYSDRFKIKPQGKREALASYLVLTPSNFPSELIQGSKLQQRDKKKLRWDRDPDEKMFDMFEKLEQNYKGQDGKVDEKKGENDEEDEEEEVEEEESSDDDDYNQNVDFDDDEDDLNMEEEGHEDVYD
ncbi:nucleolin-like [Zingiber officinale]|uniref:nucleolin-like n=1 Tax=Zingiber officinale TaxID=94328 RepID=UPI001C4A887A|nr:nucleolin-like [Zingiber officinale]XP_042379687.1 nucleolin-like [Zingiber officinale]XP_042379695.1 nucleolin-like [Zingiber officinale]XP_042379702.1 nucleolin-like [Zingiber officinale]XP_042379710.1 nucleolin-like [Zingiber officinale]XP_042379717.1 nucleolin-like [Zingiber officinale]XP_042379726.1 nucleolin-like [Zingiber officinale]